MARDIADVADLFEDEEIDEKALYAHLQNASLLSEAEVTTSTLKPQGRRAL